MTFVHALARINTALQRCMTTKTRSDVHISFSKLEFPTSRAFTAIEPWTRKRKPTLIAHTCVGYGHEQTLRHILLVACVGGNPQRLACSMEHHQQKTKTHRLCRLVQFHMWTNCAQRRQRHVRNTCLYTIRAAFNCTYVCCLYSSFLSFLSLSW